MVAFVREDPVKTSDTSNMPDWTRVSEGYTAQGTVKGKALTSFGNTVREGANLIEARYGEYVTEVAKDTAALAEVTQLGIDQGRFHPDIVRELRAVKERKDATEAGGLSQENFNTYLLAKTKELKQRYPTFQNEVDAGLRSMGYSPAQDVINDRARAAARAQSEADDMTRRDASFVDWSIKQHPQIYNTWVASGQRDGANGLRAMVAKDTARLKEIENNSLEIDNAIKRGNLEKQVVERTFGQVTNYVYDNVVTSMAGEYSAVMDNMKRYTQSLTTGEPDQKAYEQSRIMFEQLRLKSMEEARLAIRSNPGYDQFPAEAQKAIENVEKRFSNLGEYIFGKDFNSSTLAAALADGSVDSTNYKHASDPNVTAVNNAKKFMGEERYKEWAKQNPDIIKAADRAVVGDEMARVQWTNDRIGSLKETYDRMAKEGVKDPAAYRTILEDMTKTFLHPKAPMQTKARLAEYFFNPNNLGFMNALTPDSQVEMYRTLSSPEMYNEVKKLVASTGDPSIMTNFKKNLNQSWIEINEKGIADLMDFQVYSKGGALKINAATLEVEHEPARNKDGSLGNVTISPSEQRDLNRLNRTLQPIMAIIKERYQEAVRNLPEGSPPPVKPIESLRLLLQQAGLDLNAAKQPTTLDRFQEWYNRPRNEELSRKSYQEFLDAAGLPK